MSDVRPRLADRRPQADHPALGICLDSFHILSRGGDPAGIDAIPGEKIFFLQLADAPHLRMDVLQWSRHYRCFPGQGAFDVAGFAAHVLAAGYRGPLSLEVFNDVFRQADPCRTAVDAMRSLLVLEERRRSAAARRRSTAIAFVELAVDGVARDRRTLLRALGFAHAGPAPHQAGAAVGARRHPRGAQPRRPPSGPGGGRRSPSRAPTRTRPPRAPRRCWPRGWTAAAARARPT